MTIVEIQLDQINSCPLHAVQKFYVDSRHLHAAASTIVSHSAKEQGVTDSYAVTTGQIPINHAYPDLELTIIPKVLLIIDPGS